MHEIRGVWRIVLGITVGLGLATGAAAQQFVEQQATRFPQPAQTDYSNQLTIGDIDGDSDLDIIWANGGGFSSAGTPQVSRIYINNGSGVFTDESTARGAFTGLCRGVELGDIDNDGDLDMILAQDFNRQPQLLLNNGAGVFTNVTAARLPVMTLSCTRAQFGDIDNDGDLDLYLTNGGTTSRFGTGQNKIFRNNGLGFFIDVTPQGGPPPAPPAHPTLAEPQDAIFGDIDGDFDIDIRTASTASNNSRLYRNDGAGIFTVVTTPADNNCYSYDFGDIDGDGDLDLFGANASGTSANADLLLRNNGTGAFTDITPTNYTPNPTVDDNDSKFFDYDNDGDLDLIVATLASGTSTERIYNNNGAGVFTQVSGLISSVSNDFSLDVKVADLNGDGRLDIVTAQGENGSMINRIYINMTGPVDNRPPRIIATEQLANTVDRVGPYVVRVSILDDMSGDRNFFDRGITLKYTVNGGAEQSVPMRHSGGQIYRGLIPGATCGGVVSYFVEARDFANNLGVGTPKNFQVAPPSQADLNADGNVDAQDAVILAAVLVDADTDPLHVCQADVNGDGNRDGLDIQAFVLSLPTP